jgi:hypothetical protein
MPRRTIQLLVTLPVCGRWTEPGRRATTFLDGCDTCHRDGERAACVSHAGTAGPLVWGGRMADRRGTRPGHEGEGCG